jgi:hypothetical protein
MEYPHCKENLHQNHVDYTLFLLECLPSRTQTIENVGEDVGKM